MTKSQLRIKQMSQELFQKKEIGKTVSLPSFQKNRGRGRSGTFQGGGAPLRNGVTDG